MQNIVKLNVSRDTYSIREAADYSISVEELIDTLRRLNPEDKVVFSNDNGYTYGYVCEDVVEEEEVETREEEERREEIEEAESEIDSIKEDMEYDLTELEAEYENPEEGEDVMSDEEYERRKAEIIEKANEEIARIKEEHNL
jgi:ribonuclease BN (tRNA processing enzyme)